MSQESSDTPSYDPAHLAAGSIPAMQGSFDAIISEANDEERIERKRRYMAELQTNGNDDSTLADGGAMQLALRDIAETAAEDQAAAGSPTNPLPVVADVSLAPELSPTHRRLLPDTVYAKRAKALRVSEIKPEQIEMYLVELATTGLKELSAQRAGLSQRIINRIKRTDEEFRALCEEAFSMFVDDVVGELVRRAKVGWDEPVFSQREGRQIGVIRKYDGKLMELLVKKLDPTYREKFEGNVTVTGGVMLIPQMQMNAEQFAAAGQAGATAQPPTPQLPAPES